MTFAFSFVIRKGIRTISFEDSNRAFASQKGPTTNSIQFVLTSKFCGMKMQMAMSSLHNYIRMYVDLVLLVQRTQTKRNGGMVCDLRRFASKNRIRYLCKLHKLIPITIGLNSMIVLTSHPIGHFQ